MKLPCLLRLAMLVTLTATTLPAAPFGDEIVVSVSDQQLALRARGKLVARYSISTSKFGLGDTVGSFRTPLGTLFISGKFDDKLPAGT